MAAPRIARVLAARSALRVEWARICCLGCPYNSGVAPQLQQPRQCEDCPNRASRPQRERVCGHCGASCRCGDLGKCAGDCGHLPVASGLSLELWCPYHFQRFWLCEYNAMQTRWDERNNFVRLQLWLWISCSSGSVSGHILLQQCCARCVFPRLTSHLYAQPRQRHKLGYFCYPAQWLACILSIGGQLIL